nr:unnamed protein product [Callosobruchus analis]
MKIILLVTLFNSVSCDWVSLYKEAVKDVGKNPSPCQKAMLKMLANLVLPILDDLWALKMIDATSKFPSGILNLNLGNMGSFDECINTVSKDGTIKGKYCAVSVSIPLSMASTLTQKITNGTSTLDQLSVEAVQSSVEHNPTRIVSQIAAVCLPHQCSIEEINKMIKWFAFDCTTKEDIEKPLSTGATAFIVFASLVGLLMMTSTLYDLYCKQMDKRPTPILLAYSIYSNGKTLLDTKPSELSCVNGMKFFSLVWVVYGHTYGEFPVSPFINGFDIIANMDSLKSMLGQATFAVDTFFCLAGILLTYTFMKSVNKSNKFNLLSFYIHRYLRLTPALIVLIFSTMTILEYLGSGPHWKTATANFTKSCKEHWWSALFHTWYLDVDMQLHFLSPIILLPLWKYPKYGLGILAAATLGSLVPVVIIVYRYQLPALTVLAFLPERGADFMYKYYFKTHTRATTYLIGMCAGYFLYKLRYSDMTIPKFPKIPILLLWGAFIALILGLVFAGYDTLMGPEYKVLDNAMYLTFVKPVWAICICWVVLACTCGYGGIINSFLSHPAFQVLSKLSYCVYLVHYVIITLRAYSFKNGVYFSDINAYYEFWGHLGVSTILAVVWVLAFEYPIVVIEKHIFGR